MERNKRPLLVILLLMVLSSCGPSPTVDAEIFVPSPCEVISGGSTPLGFQGTIPESAQVTWEAESGSFTKNEGHPTRFIAPITDTDLTTLITAKITYQGRVFTRSLTCTIKAGSVTDATQSPVVPVPQTEAAASHVSQVNSECTLDLRKVIPSTIACTPGGVLDIQGVGQDALSDWIATLSRIDIPAGWRVLLFYETWLPPDYSERDPSKQGFVPLGEGDFSLPSPGFKVFSDKQLTSLFKESTALDELNDTTQYLLIYPTTSSELVLSANSIPPYGRELHLRYQP